MKKGLFYSVIVALLAILVIWFFVFRDKKKVTGGNEVFSHNISQHSDAFNRSHEIMMNAYYQMSEGFVNWDSATIAKYSIILMASLDSLQTEDLKKAKLFIYIIFLPADMQP